MPQLGANVLKHRLDKKVTQAAMTFLPMQKVAAELPATSWVEVSRADDMRGLMSLLQKVYLNSSEPGKLEPEVWRHILITFLTRLKIKAMRTSLEEALPTRALKLLWMLLLRTPLSGPTNKALLQAVGVDGFSYVLPGMRDAVARIFELMRVGNDGRTEYIEGLCEYFATALVPLIAGPCLAAMDAGGAGSSTQNTSPQTYPFGAAASSSSAPTMPFDLFPGQQQGPPPSLFDDRAPQGHTGGPPPSLFNDQAPQGNSGGLMSGAYPQAQQQRGDWGIMPADEGAGFVDRRFARPPVQQPQHQDVGARPRGQLHAPTLSGMSGMSGTSGMSGGPAQGSTWRQEPTPFLDQLGMGQPPIGQRGMGQPSMSSLAVGQPPGGQLLFGQPFGPDAPHGQSGLASSALGQSALGQPPMGGQMPFGPSSSLAWGP